MEVVVLPGLGLVLVGVLFVSASAGNWDWWFNSAKLKRGPLGGLSRSAQRLFYGISGSLIILLGAFIVAFPFLPDSITRKLL